MITTPPGAPCSQDAWRQGDPSFQSRISLRSFFHTTTPVRNPQTRTEREADWASGSCGSTGDDALTAPGGAR